MVVTVCDSWIYKYIREKLYKARRRQRLTRLEKRRSAERMELPPIIALPWEWRPWHASKPIDIPPRKRLF